MKASPPGEPLDEEQDEPYSVSLILIAFFALIATLYFAKLLIMPVLVAGFIALFASPSVLLLVKLRIPRALASVFTVAVIVASLSYLFSLLIEPALRWSEALPLIGDRLMFELEQSEMPLPSSDGPGDTVDQAVDSTLVTMTSAFAESSLVLLVQVATIIILTYFFLAYGEDLMRNIVKAQDEFSNKKLTVVVFQSVRDDVSTYILVISLINIGLGLCTAGTLYLIDFEDALLWGALATVLNFAPYIGPLLLAVILTAIGFAAGEPFKQVFLAPGLFLALNLTESQFVTPTVLGKRFNINPLLVVLWMFFLGWLWGAAGMLLAIPLLMCVKLISFHLQLFGSWSEVFDGYTPTEKKINSSKNVMFTQILEKIKLWRLNKRRSDTP